MQKPTMVTPPWCGLWEMVIRKLWVSLSHMKVSALILEMWFGIGGVVKSLTKLSRDRCLRFCWTASTIPAPHSQSCLASRRRSLRRSFGRRWWKTGRCSLLSSETRQGDRETQQKIVDTRECHIWYSLNLLHLENLAHDAGSYRNFKNLVEFWRIYAWSM